MTFDTALAKACGRSIAVVTGYFDPLLAAHARRLAQIHQGFETVIVLLEDPPQPVLDRRSRAELLAALAVVDCVVLSPPADFDPAARITVFKEEAADTERFERLLQHVHHRHRAGVPA